MTPKKPKSIWWDIRKQTSAKARARRYNIFFKLRSKSHKRYSGEHKQQVQPYKMEFDPNQAHSRKGKCSKCGDSKHVEGLTHLARKFQYKTCNKYGHFTGLCYKKKVSLRSRTPKAHQLQAGVVYTKEDSICSQSSDLTSSDESFCLQVKIQGTQFKSKFPTPQHLITNLEYRLKPHHKWNLYLRARLDICADVNIIPASVYKLVFQDSDCRKLAPSKPEIGTYTNDTVKLVWILCVLFGTSRYQSSTRSNILCGQ